jgi:hypothetical protein
MATRYRIQNVDAAGNERNDVVVGDDIRVSKGPSGNMTVEVLQAGRPKAKYLNVTAYDDIGPFPEPKMI